VGVRHENQEPRLLLICPRRVNQNAMSSLFGTKNDVRETASNTHRTLDKKQPNVLQLELRHLARKNLFSLLREPPTSRVFLHDLADGSGHQENDDLN